MVFGVLISACGPQPSAPAAVVLLDEQPVQPTVFVPTPTLIPTIGAVAPSATPSPIPTASPTRPADGFNAATCSTMLQAIWQSAGDVCLGRPNGYVCNGGLAPRIAPPGPVSNTLAATGALVETPLIDSIQTAPIMTAGNSAGIAWVRSAAFATFSGVMIGDVALQDVSTDDSAPWQSFIVQTGVAGTPSMCAYAPTSSFVVQSPLGGTSTMIINGVSVDLDGTLVIQTGQEGAVGFTRFMALFGRARVITLGEPQIFYAGQQVNVAYPPGDLTRPSGASSEPLPLDFDRIQYLPVSLLDRPVRLVQPGIALTEGTVNMRAEPSLSGQILRQVEAGETLSILGISPSGEWLHVQTDNGETGWIAGEVLRQFLGPIEQVYSQTPLPPDRLGDLGLTARVNKPQGANLREAPDIAFEVIAVIPYDAQVNLVARSPYSPWVKVEVNGMIGWMALITLDTSAGVDLLPIHFDVPPQPTPGPPTPVPVYDGNAFPLPAG